MCDFISHPQTKKKMVRYINNQVVTTRGERNVEIKKPESEEMKKTYINLKPGRKYRFHWKKAKSVPLLYSGAEILEFCKNPCQLFQKDLWESPDSSFKCVCKLYGSYRESTWILKTLSGESLQEWILWFSKNFWPWYLYIYLCTLSFNLFIVNC